MVWNSSASVATLPADGVRSLFNVPAFTDLGTIYFLRLSLYQNNTAEEADVTVVTRHVYWLSTAEDVLDYDKSTFYITPCTAFADYTALETLPPVKLLSRLSTVEKQGEEGRVITESTATLTNPSSVIAFFVRVRIVRDRDQQDVLPVFWDDNYVTLLPGETVQLKARYNKEDLNGGQPSLIVEVWNNISGGKSQRSVTTTLEELYL